MVYVYAILRSADVAKLHAGASLQSRGLLTQNASGVAAVFTKREGSAERTATNAIAHEQIVEHLMSRVTVLPARLGVEFDSHERLRALLDTHASPLLTGLDRVEGCVEVGVRVIRSAAPTTSKTSAAMVASGSDYMRRRLAEEQAQRAISAEAERIADTIHAPLAALARDSTRRPTSAGSQLVLAAAYLVPREDVAVVTEQARGLGTARDDIRLLCTGPWPPYHFVPALDLSAARPPSEVSNA